MGSVFSNVECNQCGFTEAFLTTYYRIGEWEMICPRCGHTEWRRNLIDRSTQGDGERFKQKHNGYPISRHYIRIGYGVLYTSHKPGAGDIESLIFFQNPLSASKILSIIKKIRMDEQIDLTNSCLVTWDQTTSTSIVHFGTPKVSICGIDMDFNSPDGLSDLYHLMQFEVAVESDTEFCEEPQGKWTDFSELGDFEIPF